MYICINVYICICIGIRIGIRICIGICIGIRIRIGTWPRNHQSDWDYMGQV